MNHDQADALLQLIEAQPDIVGRFVAQRRHPDGQEGHFSLVFQATDKESGDFVALKFLAPGHEAYRQESFAREARILERLQGQEHIIRLAHPLTKVTFPIDTAGGWRIGYPFDFFALEWANSSLQTLIAQGGSEARTTVRQFREVCKGVQRLHARRIGHRDLKPGNCLVLPSGPVVVGDFGTAHDYGDGTSPLLARYDRPVGDWWYTGLEILCGLGDDISLVFASEFFALGAILFELLTLNQLAPYVYGKAMDLAAHLQATPPGSRRTVFDGLVSSLAESWRLPDIRDFTTTVPPVIRDRVNRLYCDLAQLDYRRRLRDFGVVFRELEACGRLLERERAYQRWLEFKRRRREAKLAKVGSVNHLAAQGSK